MSTQAKCFQNKYNISASVMEFVARAMLKHPECKKVENRKLLVLKVWRLQCPAFNAALNQDPALEERMLRECADSDTVLRRAREWQNDEGRYQDPDTAASKTIEGLGASRLDKWQP